MEDALEVSADFAGLRLGVLDSDLVELSGLNKLVSPTTLSPRFNGVNGLGVGLGVGLAC